MYRYGGGSMAPDVNSQYSSQSGGGLDYGSLFKSASGKKGGMGDIFGGGGKSSGGGGGSFGISGGGMGGGIVGQLASANYGGQTSGSGPVGMSANDAAVNWRLREAMPYMVQQETAQQNADAQMAIAQMNAKAGLASNMMELEARRMEMLQMQQDNEKNRQAQLEMQRRGFGADDYATKQDYYLRYGIS